MACSCMTSADGKDIKPQALHLTSSREQDLSNCLATVFTRGEKRLLKYLLYIRTFYLNVNIFMTDNFRKVPTESECSFLLLQGNQHS